MILIARFYHWPSGSAVPAPWDKGFRTQHLPLLRSEEWLAAWAVLRLTKLYESCKVMVTGAMKKGEPGMPVWNTGTHTLTLYHGPVPPVAALSAVSAEQKHCGFKMYGDASLRLHIFSTQKPELPFPPESPLTLDPAKTCPHEAFIHHVRKTPPVELFSDGDGFDLYIDGARFLPDDVTVTRVAARIFTSDFSQIGPDIFTGIDLNSSIFDPLYNYSVKIREAIIPPCATLLLKIYSISRLTSELIQIGWAALSVFVECGTHTIPEPGGQGIQVSLNDGAHQLRIFHNGPCPDQPFSTSSLTTVGRYVPCATLLVRLIKAPVNSNHQTLQRNMVPWKNWAKLGLFQSRPDYSDVVYYSDSAKPTAGESCLYEVMGNRSAVSVREIVHQLEGQKSLTTDEEICTWIHQKLTRVAGSRPQPFNLTCISRYIPSYGIKFALDRGMNLPWSGLTVAHFCFNPPGACYFGAQWQKYDYPIFVEEVDKNSYQQWPAWLDGFKSCPHRVYHEYSTIIIHLYQSVVNAAQDALGEKENVQTAQRRAMLKGGKLHYSLRSKAWTALHVFSRGYCNTGIYQLPLYQGTPSQSTLTSLSEGKCISIMNRMLQKKEIQLVPGASVVVRVADGRWDNELRYKSWEIDQSYLPKTTDLYDKEPSGGKITELIPQKTSQKQTRLMALEQL
ncbi:uncharacterized protein LOC133386710 [Rhineura floridana]|uniref:uncharacterized protein LOC133386710 n=1 Tax=Rhineura floridana TaxID=261503 RepID=UPI002AC883AD|nr:uncharacterized protein LOC133386710 [Rhineura floridana]